MPVSPTYPGVYIEEIPSGVRTTVGVSTSVTAFLDFFDRGPINGAVQLFNMGDFQREYGGLHTHSEASYGIHQFFSNGGSAAWVVRVPSQGGREARLMIRDQGGTNDIFEVHAGRQIRGASVVDHGTWGNNLRIDVSYDTDGSEAEQFNLTVTEVKVTNGREVPVTTESYRNLTMGQGTRSDAIAVVNAKSNLIQLVRKGADGTRPAQTGTTGVDASGGGTDAVGNVSDGETLKVEGRTVTLKFSNPPASLEDVRKALEKAIHVAGATASGGEVLEGATVELIGNAFRVLGGRGHSGYDAGKLLSIAEDGGSTAADLGLLGGDSFPNVQQYSLGATSSDGAQADVTDGEGADGDLPTELPGSAELLGTRAAKTGLYALENVDIFNILCIPRAADLGKTDMQAVYSAAESYCEERRAFLLVDPDNSTDLEGARDWLGESSGLRHENAAAYFPRLRVPDPLQDFRLREVAPSGTVAGVYARTDSARGVWKAPAGIDDGKMANVPDLVTKLSDAENGQLNPKGLNVVRNFDTFGNVVWGARTLQGADRLASEWKYVPVRRLALYLEETLYRSTKWVVFEPNDQPLWAQIRLNVGAFMQSLFLKGAFQGTSPRDAYLVKCDSETTTQNDIDQGIVNVLVGFAPLKPAEFLILKIQQLAGQSRS